MPSTVEGRETGTTQLKERRIESTSSVSGKEHAYMPKHTFSYMQMVSMVFLQECDGMIEALSNVVG